MAEEEEEKPGTTISLLVEKEDSNKSVQPQSENFIKKVKKWQKNQRSDVKGVPSHRTATLKAVESGDNLTRNIHKDVLSLENVEESLNAMKTYVEVGDSEFTTKDEIMHNRIDVDDCIKVKNDTKANVKNAQKIAQEKVESENIVVSNVEQPLPAETQKKSGILGGTVVGGGKGLKLARLHNQSRLNKLKQNRKQDNDDNKQQAEKDGNTFLTGLNIESQEKELIEEPHSQFVPEKPYTATTSFNNVPLVQNHMASAPLSSDDVHTPPEKPRQPPRTKNQKAVLTDPSAKKLLESTIVPPIPTSQDKTHPTKISKYTHHGSGASAPSLSIHDVHSLHSSFLQRQHMATRSRSSARRGSTGNTSNLNGENDDTLLEEEVAERQLMWLMKVEAKNRAAKREKESRIIDELKIVPDVTAANASWAKAKKAHAREINKEREAELMKKKLENMKSEMQLLRMEEKAIRLRKIQHSRHVEMAQMANINPENAIPRKKREKKAKRKKRKGRHIVKQSDDDDEASQVVSHKQQHGADERAEMLQKFKQRIPVTARGGGMDHAPIVAGSGASGVKHLNKMRNRPKSANAVMKWSTLKSYDKKFDVLDMVLSPTPSDEGGGVFSQLPSSTRRKGDNSNVDRSKTSPLRPPPSTGGWVDGPDSFQQNKKPEGFDVGENGECDHTIAKSYEKEDKSQGAPGRKQHQRNVVDHDHDDDGYGLSLHDKYRQMQQTSQQEYLSARPYMFQPPIKKQEMPCNLSCDAGNAHATQQSPPKKLSTAEDRNVTSNKCQRFNRRNDDSFRPHQQGSLSNGSPRRHCQKYGNNNFSQDESDEQERYEALDERIQSMCDRQALIESRRGKRNEAMEAQRRQQQDFLRRQQEEHYARQREEAYRWQQHELENQQRIAEARQASMAQQTFEQNQGVRSNQLSGNGPTATFRNALFGDGTSVIPKNVAGFDTHSVSSVQEEVSEQFSGSQVHNCAHSPPPTSRSNISHPSSSAPSHMAGRFFDQTSTADKGRHRVHDAREFDTKSMFRKPDIINEGVTLLMGKKRSTGEMGIITILFDRAKFSEEGARIWWNENQDRLLAGEW